MRITLGRRAFLIGAISLLLGGCSHTFTPSTPSDVHLTRFGNETASDRETGQDLLEGNLTVQAGCLVINGHQPVWPSQFTIRETKQGNYDVIDADGFVAATTGIISEFAGNEVRPDDSYRKTLESQIVVYPGCKSALPYWEIGNLYQHEQIQ